ncbi:hypothetical protein JXA85_00075 [Candidatus Woesearchaeota archaeon]|nr:hypothetical protein [Candidatus Woesearchaeota archaeon]
MAEKRNVLDEFAIQFAKIVDKYTDYIIVFGFVAISSGRARATEDIDMLIKPVEEEKFLLLHTELNKSGFSCLQSKKPAEVYEYLKSFVSVRYVKDDELLPQMELKFAKDELDEYQFKTRTKLKLTGLDLWFSNVNVNLAFKEHLLKSQKDLEDAKHLRIVYAELLSEEEIKKVKEMIDRCRLKGKEKLR